MLPELCNRKFQYLYILIIIKPNLWVVVVVAGHGFQLVWLSQWGVVCWYQHQGQDQTTYFVLFLHFLPVAKLMGIIQQELIKCHYCPLFWYWVIHFSSPTNGTVSVRIFYSLLWHILPSIYLGVWNLIPYHRCYIEDMECLSSLTSLCLLCYMPSGCYEPQWMVEWMFLDSCRHLKINSICKVLRDFHHLRAF